jgi:CBS domain-containing protein
MHVKDICSRSLVTCRRDLSVTKVAQLMRDQFVEDVIVVDERAGRLTPVGIVTFRDMIVRVLANHADPERTLAGDIMSGALETALETDLLYTAIARMRDRRISRLIVIDSHDALVGELTADDATDFLACELAEVARISPRRIAMECRPTPRAAA